MTLDALFQQLDARTMPPLDRWDPPHCGDMDLVIAANGDWIHEGAPIRRPALVSLLSRVLRREADGDYYLVTPVEKLRVRVEDLPLIVTDADSVGADWFAVTACGDRVALNAEHRLTLVATPDGHELPALSIRHGLQARVHRNLFYRWVEGAEIRRYESLDDGTRDDEIRGDEIGFWSGGVWHSLGRLDDEPT